MVNLFSVCKMINPKRRNKFLTLGLLTLSMTGTYSEGHAREMIEYPRVKLRTLDKGTARTQTYDANVGDTLKFGDLYMKVQTCQKSGPLEQPESAAFIQIWKVEAESKPKWLFSGWMFASSPALSAMDHPLYDVWVVDCLGDPINAGEQNSATNAQGEDTDKNISIENGASPDQESAPQ